jgi:myo-inositol-1(or 4)-monophosphatase
MAKGAVNAATLDRDPPAFVDDAELRELTGFACRLADAAGAEILPHFRAPIAVRNKAGADAYDPVTAADLGSESAMRALIRSAYPDHGIYGEEGGHVQGAGALTWVIDPLDGTRAFITGALHWGVLIALYDGARPILGVMDQPYTRERFVGNRLGARWMREGGERRLATRPCTGLGEAVLYTTSPEMFSNEAERRAFELLASRVKLARYGGDCYSYCMLASGYVDLVVESDLKPYDIQALIPIIEAAGGIVTSWTGGAAHYGGAIVAAGSAEVHAAALRVLQGREPGGG